MASRRPVLVVESDLTVQGSLVSILSGDGYEATVVATGAEALAWLRLCRQDPCAILLPASMAAGGGREFLECLEREFPRLFSSLPIIFAREN